MSTSPSPKGALLHRLCPSCDTDVVEDRTTCATCGSKLVEVRDELDTTVGTVIDDRFEVRAKIGQGGMGTVYRAWQRSIGREVAIKLMDRSYSRDTMAVRRFLREAKLASQLSQPNSVSIFDFGQAADGRLFIAMELIRGRTLHEVVQTDGAFSVERCVRIGSQICDALEAAHTVGIVHRDLKLENVIVLEHPPGRDLVKVLDFGLAKNIRDPGSRATESGIVVGTPRYMSPEAATTGVTGPAGDLYSLGVILGELSAGKPMWTGDTLSELIQQKMDPRGAVARAAPQLRPLLAKLLDPEPEHRPTAEQVRAMLQAAATAEPGAGETLVDPEPGATTNIRTPSPRPTGADATRPPERLAPTRPTMPSRPRRGSAEDAESLPASSRPRRGGAEAAEALSPSPSLIELDRPPPRRWPLLVVGLGALAAVVVAIVISTRGDDGSTTPTRAAAPIDAALVAHAVDASMSGTVVIDAAVATSMVTIRVTSSPPGASVTHGGQSETTPFSIIVPRSSESIELVGKLAGHVTTSIKIVPDGDKPAVLKLRARAGKSRPDPSDLVAPF